MAPSGYLALCCIALGGSLTLMGSTLTRFTRWLSVGATLAAVAEHGYQSRTRAAVLTRKSCLWYT